MPTQHLPVASLDGELCRIDLTYDDATLAVSAARAVNGGTSPAWIEVRSGGLQAAGTLAAGSTSAVAVPVGAFALQRISGPDGGLILSYAPWSIETRYPA